MGCATPFLGSDGLGFTGWCQGMCCGHFVAVVLADGFILLLRDPYDGGVAACGGGWWGWLWFVVADMGGFHICWR
ncbi:hypothetical protein MtrunA17_Chr7g0232001 [Medicago truncatula]|uniref:Uncharacterized protein n=1 Tax=Medicago truncatula TaxID=3880 RepID=A0A396GYE5_MEDTR|nr:hypothetical protein MtrunA17_Chr7g0232001 [Medicago truncatula]